MNFKGFIELLRDLKEFQGISKYFKVFLGILRELWDSMDLMDSKD